MYAVIRAGGKQYRVAPEISFESRNYRPALTGRVSGAGGFQRRGYVATQSDARG